MSASDNANAVCTRVDRNTLTTNCYSACRPTFPLCVNYAARPSNESLKQGDGNYYYQGCAFTAMKTCMSNVGPNDCELQCLQSTNVKNEEWIMDVAPPQADRAETSLFLYVDKLKLPPTLRHLKIVGTTELTRKVPLAFANDAFASGFGLQNITILDVSVDAINNNIFPTNLTRLVMQRTQLQQFEPLGNRRLPQLRSLDLSENSLSAIPPVVFELESLKELHLRHNSISDVHLTSSQLSFLRKLDVLDVDLSVSGKCRSGYASYTWAGNSVCIGEKDGVFEEGSMPQGDKKSSAAASTKSSILPLIIAGMVAFVVLAVLAGIFILKRAKQKKTELVDEPERKERPKPKSLGSSRILLTHKSSELADPLEVVSPARKATFREMSSSQVDIQDVLSQSSAVTVMTAQYNRTAVLVSQLKISDDPAENCETALNVTPVIAQLRHPQLLTVLGLMWEDMHTMSVVSEFMNRGTLEEYLLAPDTGLTWRNFKKKAAHDITVCLMYLHGQHKLTYEGLSGRTVYVDSEKGCKLNTVIASLPSGSMKPQLARATRAFCAPEVIAGDRPTAASDMYAFGVLLAQLDTCMPANEMIRQSWKNKHYRPLAISLLESSDSSQQTEEESDLSSSQSTDTRTSTSLSSMFSFTKDCPEPIKELAISCLQYDPSMRPSAQYVTAMLQHLP
ncbi:hypothetical protein PINS_up003741 [Pythium insidiosum]|nr:hypothetical protein PINS_up003741 [Pythium insidiosum]